MFNQDFLKTLTILYVEDDKLAREKLAKILKRFFKTVIVSSNGSEGLSLFLEQKKDIDLILSDINMPIMDGLEMLEKIREVDSNIPIIYTTARTESTELLKAIELQANHYVLKPVDIEDVIKRIQKVCEKIFYENLTISKNRELEQFLGIIDHAALIIKINQNKEITYINTLFLESLQVVEDEIIGKKFSEIIHKETAGSVIEELWETLSRGKSWHADIKYLNKDNEIFFINSTIFQIIHDDGYEYINIGFVSTNEVLEKREFHKKIISNIKQSKLEAVKTNKEIIDLKSKINNIKNDDSYQHEVVTEQKDKIRTLKSQIQFYEKELLEKDNNNKKSIVRSKKNLEKMTELYKSSVTSIESLRKDITDFKEADGKNKDEIIKLEDVVKEQRDLIRDLRDTIKNISEEKEDNKKDANFLKKLIGN